MSKAKEVKRLYNLSDAEMIQYSRVIYNLYQSDKQLFVNFDPSFNELFNTTFNESLTDAEGIGQEMMVKDELVQFTETVQAKMTECRTYFQKLKYFIEKAFPSNKGIEKAFGYDEYQKVYHSEAEMIRFYNALKIQVNLHKAQLLEAGMKEDEINKVSVLYNDLFQADQAQELCKLNKSKATQERLKIFNKVWEQVMAINKASAFVFADDYAKLNQYQLPVKTTPTVTEPIG